MGLDLSFNRTAAVNAGLKLSIERNGTDADIFIAKSEEYPDTDYINWLESLSEVVEIPGTDMVTDNTGFDDTIVMRANQWGRIYEPMTEWLKANNITWGEF